MSASKWKTYPAYTEIFTHKPIIGPSSWDITPLKHVLEQGFSDGSLIKGKMFQTPSKGLYDGYSASGQDIWVEIAQNNRPGLVLSAVGARCGKVFLARGSWTAIANTHVFFPAKQNDLIFLWYLTNDETFWDKGGAAQPFVNISSTLSHKHFIPSVDEQRLIGAFLNNKIPIIDKTIEKYQRLIKMFDKKRLDLIKQTVTKGLNQQARMKSSGIGWIGDIPENWLISMAKRHSEIFVPERNKPKQNPDGIGIPWITTSNIGAVYVSEDDTELWVSEIEIDENGIRVLPQNSVIATCVGDFGVSSINVVDCVINQQLQAYVTHSIHPEYLRYILIAGKQYFESVCNVTTLSYINKEKFGEIPIPYPSIHEQKEIAEYLTEKLSSISDTCNKIEKSLTRMLEYRTALISAAVTGKIDLR
jgi:type I restriction enzyme S subunit